MKDNFTPGPWVAGKNVVGADRTVVCQVNRPAGGDIGVENANARLIAAAPELLEAAHWVCKLFGTDNPKGIVELKQYVGQLRDAVKKAQGGAA